jgi:hypothetical protein
MTDRLPSTAQYTEGIVAAIGNGAAFHICLSTNRFRRRSEAW